MKYSIWEIPKSLYYIFTSPVLFMLNFTHIFYLLCYISNKIELGTQYDLKNKMKFFFYVFFNVIFFV